MAARRGAAAAWRLDYATDPDREELWRCYVAGATVYARLDREERAATRKALAAAERDVPWTGSGDPS